MTDLFRARIIPILPGDRLAAGLALASLITLTAHWVIVLRFVVPRLGRMDFLRLHYTAGLGVDRVGPWWHVFAAPAAGLAILLVGALVAALLVRSAGDARRARAFSLLILSATLVQQCILLVGGAIAVSLNS